MVKVTKSVGFFGFEIDVTDVGRSELTGAQVASIRVSK